MKRKISEVLWTNAEGKTTTRNGRKVAGTWFCRGLGTPSELSLYLKHRLGNHNQTTRRVCDIIKTLL